MTSPQPSSSPSCWLPGSASPRSDRSSSSPPVPTRCAALAGEGFEVFLDLKLHDIPTTVARGAEQAGRLGATYLTVHAAGGDGHGAGGGRRLHKRDGSIEAAPRLASERPARRPRRDGAHERGRRSGRDTPRPGRCRSDDRLRRVSCALPAMLRSCGGQCRMIFWSWFRASAFAARQPTTRNGRRRRQPPRGPAPGCSWSDAPLPAPMSR